MKKVKSVAFSITFGVVEGYFHDNQLPTSSTPSAILAEEWKNALSAEFAENGQVVGGVIMDSRTVYPGQFGCPEGGELTATVSGESNPKFDKDPDKFKEAVLRIARKVRKALGQERIRIAFTPVVDYVYLEPEDEGGEQRWTE